VIVDLLIMPDGTQYITSRQAPGKMVKVKATDHPDLDPTLAAIRIFKERYDAPQDKPT